MRKKIISISLCSILLFGCGSSKPSWERDQCCDKPKVTQNDHAFMGILLSGLILFTLHTFTTR